MHSPWAPRGRIPPGSLGDLGSNLIYRNYARKRLEWTKRLRIEKTEKQKWPWVIWSPGKIFHHPHSQAQNLFRRLFTGWDFHPSLVRLKGRLLCRAQLSFWWLVPENSRPLAKRWQGLPQLSLTVPFSYSFAPFLFSFTLHSHSIEQQSIIKIFTGFNNVESTAILAARRNRISSLGAGHLPSSMVELLLGLCGNPHIASMNAPCLVLRGHVIFHTLSAHLLARQLVLRYVYIRTYWHLNLSS